ncbi:MAG: 1-acyl-sn-glycerol-3-phosphate acyltransferase [Bacilli bacterium]|nr:1-acyl-sn-glycerol-3-phosphate acyltransferase [Bacilli bacterium]
MDVVEKDPLFYRIVRPILTFLFKVLYRPTIIGKEHIPKSGRIVIAGNHTNNFDCVLLIASTKRCVHFLAKDELYKGFKKYIFKYMGIIPVNRRQKDGKSLKKAIDFLNKDMAIGIFPEGTFNRSENTILPFKIGAVKMAHDTNTKIAPFVIKGKYKLFKKSVKIVFFEPLEIKDSNLDVENQRLMDLVSEKLEDSEV